MKRARSCQKVLPVTLQATSRGSDASMVIQSSHGAKTGILPLPSPTAAEQKELVLALVQKLAIALDHAAPTKLDEQQAIVRHLLQLVYGNLRLHDFLFQQLGTAPHAHAWDLSEMQCSP